MIHRKRAPVIGFATLLSSFAAVAVSAAEQSLRPDENQRSVTLLYIADVHGLMEPHPELFWQGEPTKIAMAGGLARIAVAVVSIRRERPGRVPFMDAGDIIQGSGAAPLTEGHCLCSPYNQLELDLAVPGNWSVVYAKEMLSRRVNQFLFPFVAANVYHADKGA